MPENPYQSNNASSSPPTRTRSTRWLVWAGAASLVLAVGCLVASVVAMRMAFATIARGGATPKPSDVAHGISLATLPSWFAIPLAILGIVLLVTGLVVRQPHDRVASE